MTPWEWFRTFQQRPEYVADPDQLVVVEHFETLYQQIRSHHRQSAKWIRHLWRANDSHPLGIYLFGSVGRGKSVLMDGFCECLDFVIKRRIHFHEFMREVHQLLNEASGQENPLLFVAQELASQAKVYCLDEFFVADIADAMILFPLLEAMSKSGIFWVITSNFGPRALYPEGLHRERFFPAIEWIENNLDVIELVGLQDHRAEQLGSGKFYFMPIDSVSDARMDEIFRRLCPIPSQECSVTVLGRTIPVLGWQAGVVWFEFSVICGSGRSQLDYLDLVERFQVFMISHVPVLTERYLEEAYRFTWLVDICCDHRKRLMMSAQDSPDALFQYVDTQEAQRTISRLRTL